MKEKGKQQYNPRVAKCELLVKNPRGMSGRQLNKECCSSATGIFMVVISTQMALKSPSESVEV